MSRRPEPLPSARDTFSERRDAGARILQPGRNGARERPSRPQPARPQPSRPRPARPQPSPSQPERPQPARSLLGSALPPPDDVAARETAPATCEFEAEGRRWIARVTGETAYGTGVPGAAPLVCVSFFEATAPDTASRQVLLPRGRFEALYIEELRALLARAPAAPPPPS